MAFAWSVLTNPSDAEASLPLYIRHLKRVWGTQRDDYLRASSVQPVSKILLHDLALPVLFPKLVSSFFNLFSARFSMLFSNLPARS